MSLVEHIPGGLWLLSQLSDTIWPCAGWPNTGALNPHLRSPIDPLPCERMRDPLHILIKPIAQHPRKREKSQYGSNSSHLLTSLPFRLWSQVLPRSNSTTISCGLGWESQDIAACVMRSSSRAFEWYLGQGGSAGWFARDPAACVTRLCSVRVASTCRASAWMCYCTCCCSYGLDGLLDLCHMMFIELVYM